MAATHSYRAVPSIFTVAPNGSTKLLVRLDTPAFFSTHSSVMGSVADDDEVENAVNNAGAMALYMRNGLTRATKYKSSGNVIKKCTPKANTTVAANDANGKNADMPVLATTLATRANTP